MPRRFLSGPVLAFSLLALAVLFYLGLTGPRWMDLELCYGYARNFFDGVDSGLFLSNYPPFALAYFLLPMFFSSELGGYLGAFEALNLVLFAATLWLVYAFAKERKADAFAAAMKYAVLAVPLTNIFLWRYDLLPALLAFAAAFLFLKGRRSLGFSVLLVAGGLKIFPLLLLPLFFLAYRGSGRRALAKDFLPPAAVVTVLYFLAAHVLASGRSLFDILFFNLGRYVEIESVYSSVVLAVGSFVPSLRPETVTALSVDVRFPLESGVMLLSTALMAAALLAVYWSAYRSGKSVEKELPSWCALALLAFLLTTKVFSVQYVLWLAPFLPFCLPKDRRFFALCAAAFFLSALVCPYLFRALVAQEPLAIAVLLLRNVLLAAVFVRLFQSLRKT